MRGQRSRFRALGYGALGLGLVLASTVWIRPPIAKADEEASPTRSAEAWGALIDTDQVSAILDLQKVEFEKSMRSSGTFRRARKKMEIAGQTLAVVGNMEAIRLSGEAALKAVSLREAGLALSAAAEERDFEAATAAVEAITAYPDSIKPAESADATEWTELIDLEALMVAVANADNESKAVAEASSEAAFKKEAESAAGHALLLACLGRIARDYESDPEWKKWCDDMTTGSKAFAEAFAKRDQTAVKSARDTLMKSCSECHEAYRVDE